MSQSSRFLGNLLAIIAVGLGLAYLADHTLLWFGLRPWFFCSLYPIFDLVIGHLVAIVLVMVGLFVFVLSGLKNTAAGILVLGGISLSAAPSVFSGYLGAYCRSDGQFIDQGPKTRPGAFPGSATP